MKIMFKLCILAGIALCCSLSVAFAAINTTPASQLQYLRLQMAMDSINTDDMLIMFKDNAKMTYNGNEDAYYLQGYGEVSLYSYSQDNVPLAINVIPLPKNSAEAVGLYVSAKNDGAYKLNLTELQNIPPLYDIWLFDEYKKDSVNIRVNKTYSFNIYKNNPASYGGKRFALVIRQNITNAYHLISFTATKLPGEKQVQLAWKTADELGNINFTVERSTDRGTNYKAIGSILASGKDEYELMDNDPLTGENLYRLKEETGGKTVYSNAATIIFSSQGISIYPNPVNNRISFSIISGSTNAQTYKIEFMNSTGLIVKEVISADPQWQGSVNNLLPGIYMVHVLNSKSSDPIGSVKFMKL